MKKPIAITAGEPSGIGYDIIVTAIQKKRSGLPWLVFADPHVLRERAQILNLPIEIDLFQSCISSEAKTVTVWPITYPDTVIPGQLNVNHVAVLINSLSAAAQTCLQDNSAALLTLPVHKGIINQANIPFRGHTEFFSELAHIKEVVMMLAAKHCRVALVTTHLPLNQVSAAITREKISNTITILCAHLKRFHHLHKPTIFVTGLNPHAGESGYLGREEIEIIEPALEELRNQLSIHLMGPLAADTVFQPKYLEQADAIVAMYHDQGLAPLKAMHFGKIVNITCGLPFIRTSVDHGVALDVAGTGKTEIESFMTAIEMIHTYR